MRLVSRFGNAVEGGNEGVRGCGVCCLVSVWCFQAGTAGAMTAPAGESDEDSEGREGLAGPGKQVAWGSGL